MATTPSPTPGSTAIVLVAAGRGSRMGAERPKQYLDLAGRPVIRHTIEACLAAPEIAALVVVIHPDDATAYDEAVADLDDPRLLPPVNGADTRAGSVRAGLEALVASTPARVLIHDAARPFLSIEVIRRVIDALGTADGAFAALPVVDALWSVEGAEAVAPVSREALWRAQTPQGFAFQAILAAHRQNDRDSADDVAVARAAGLRVVVVEGDEANFKITTPADMARARALRQS